MTHYTRHPGAMGLHSDGTTSGLPTTRQVTLRSINTSPLLKVYLQESGGYEASLPRLAVRYNPSAWSPAPAAGPYLPRTSAFVLHAGVPFPFSIRRLWSRIEMLSCLS